MKLRSHNGSPNDFSRVFEIHRERQKTVGTIVIPEQVTCLCCKSKTKTREQMGVVPNTGIVRNVMDCVCMDCTRMYAKELARGVRIVCAGCREVVDIVAPGRERSGFVWREGACVHVPICPACSPNRKLRSSPIAEKIAFYKANGIPYE